MVQLIISLGTSLGMETTAEGVETEAQYACLQALGCTHVQGYLFARPKPADELGHETLRREQEERAPADPATGARQADRGR